MTDVKILGTKLMAEVLRIFMQEVSRDLRSRCQALFKIAKSQSGAVTFIQRFGSALNLNVHFHAAVLDGVYAADAEGRPEFWELPAPEDEDVKRVVSRVAERVEARVRVLELGRRKRFTIGERAGDGLAVVQFAARPHRFGN